MMRRFFCTLLVAGFLSVLFGCISHPGGISREDSDYRNLEAAEFVSSLVSGEGNPEGSVVHANGRLEVVGSELCNESGDPVQLRGMSAFWINWEPGEKYANADVVNHLAGDWGIDVYRLAVGVNPDDNSGYIGNPEKMRNMIEEVVDACIRKGIYVIIDWHAHDTLGHVREAGEFFKGVAETWGDYPNIIYELWNEPVKSSWKGEIKPYSEILINDVIRPIDPRNIIVIGSRDWSQQVEECADDPVIGSNLMYALHFYAGTHGEWLRKRADNAMNKGIAIFVTEWGTSDSSGGSNGNLYFDASDIWIEWMNSRGISWANWSVADKNESSAALKPGAPARGGWSDAHLSESGRYVKERIAE